MRWLPKQFFCRPVPQIPWQNWAAVSPARNNSAVTVVIAAVPPPPAPQPPLLAMPTPPTTSPPLPLLPPPLPPPLPPLSPPPPPHPPPSAPPLAVGCYVPPQVEWIQSTITFAEATVRACSFCMRIPTAHYRSNAPLLTSYLLPLTSHRSADHLSDPASRHPPIRSFRLSSSSERAELCRSRGYALKHG